MNNINEKLKLLEIENGNQLTKIEINGYLVWPIIKEVIFGYIFIIENRNNENVIISSKLKTISLILKSFIKSTFFFIRSIKSKKPNLIITNGIVRKFKNNKNELINIWLDGYFLENILSKPFLIEKRVLPIKNSAIKLEFNSLYIDYIVLFYSKFIKKKNFNLCINEIQKIIKNYDINVPDSLLINTLVSFFSNKFIYKLFFKKINPNLLITYNFLCTGILAAANELNIPNFDVQHGIIGQYYPSYNLSNAFKKYKNKIALPNKIAVFGNLEKEEMLKNLFWEENEINSCGSYNMFLNKNLKINKNKKDILICTENIKPDKMLEIIRILMINNINIVLKLHPFESNENKKKFFSLQTEFNQLIKLLPLESDLYFQLNKSKIVIAHNSTVLLEARELGAHVISIELELGDNGICYYYRNEKLKSLIHICNSNNILQTIEYLKNLDLTLNFNCNNFLFNNDYINSNKKMVKELTN